MRKLFPFILAITIAFNLSIDQATAQKSYRKYANKREFKGYKLNSGQRKALGLKNGLLNTGIAKNWKVFQGKRKLSNKQVATIRKENQPKTKKNP